MTSLTENNCAEMVTVFGPNLATVELIFANIMLYLVNFYHRPVAVNGNATERPQLHALTNTTMVLSGAKAYDRPEVC